MAPFFSVIIPTYNNAGILENTLQSVLSQTFSNFEVLVMDDGSNDGTDELIRKINDQRLIYEWDENFGGPSKPRNRGIARSRGEWICFLDADDGWTPEKLQVCYDTISDNVDLIYHDLEIVGAIPAFPRSRVLRGKPLYSPIYKDLLINGNTISNSSVVIRRSILLQIGSINESREMIASEDYNAWLKVAMVTDKFLYIPRVLGYYRQHTAGISRKDMTLCTQAACSDFLYLLSTSEMRRYFARITYIKACHLYSVGRYRDAVKGFLDVVINGTPLLSLKAFYLWLVASLQRIFRRG